MKKEKVKKVKVVEVERLEKSDMVTEDRKEVFSLAKEALDLNKKIEKMKLSLSYPINKLITIKEKLARDFEELNIPSIIVDKKGLVTLVNSQSAARLDEKKIAAKLGVKNLDEFKIPGKPISFIKVSNTKK